MSIFLHMLNPNQTWQVQGGGQEGTRVKHAKTSVIGEVVGFFVDVDDGYNGFDIQWHNREEQSKYTTREVLEGAERYGGGQGVPSPATDDDRVRLFLRAVLCMVNVQVRQFLLEDDTKVKRKRRAQPLGDNREKIMGIRKSAWGAVQGASLTDTMTKNEQSVLREAGGGLLQEVSREKSLPDALGLAQYSRSGVTGFVNREYTFHDSHVKFVNHFVRGAQTSWKLGRPTSLESCIAPLCMGGGIEGAVDEFSGVQLREHELSETVYSIAPDKASSCGLGVRLLLARARVSTDSAVDSFKWWTHCPLYRQFEFTRPKILGDISPTTENTGRVSLVRRHKSFYKSVVKSSLSKAQDLDVLGCIFQAYEPVANDKRNEAAAHENDLARIGHGSKVNAGRTMSDWEKECEFLGKLVKECGIDPVMQKIGDAGRREEVIAICLKVLEDGGGASMGTRTDENHLYPEAHRESIDKVVGVLKGGGVSVEDLERFSGALHILDSLTSACLRPQDSLGCLACRAYIKNGRLVFRLPSVAKNSVTLLKSAAGMVVNHVKDEATTGGPFFVCVGDVCTPYVVASVVSGKSGAEAAFPFCFAGPYAVMLVIGRRLMRLRLQENYQKACDELERAREQYDVEKGRGGKQAAAASKRLKKAEGEVKKYAVKKIDRSAQADKVKNNRRSQTRVLRDAELGDKAAPFTKYGKNYTNDQLLKMYKHVGKYALGLPAFGPNILRTIHVTTVMTLCYQMDISVDDQRVKDHFALARHGEYEMRRSYNLVKTDNVEYDASSFSAKVSGIIGAQNLLQTKLRPDFGVVQESLLKECFGTSLFDGLKRQEGEGSLETMMRELLRQTSQVLSMQGGAVSSQNIPWSQDAIAAENEKRIEKALLEAAECKARRRALEQPNVSAGVGAFASCKHVPDVGESQETGRKRGLDVSKGEGCKSADDDSERPKTRAKRGTFTVESMPLLRRMNAIFKEKVVEMKLDPTKSYKRGTLENTMFHGKTFQTLTLDRVRDYLQQNCKDNADVKEFYDLNAKENNIRNVLVKVRKSGGATEWSDWLCRACNKVECGCPSQEN